jgi:type IV secretion system protein VirB9
MFRRTVILLSLGLAACGSSRVWAAASAAARPAPRAAHARVVPGPRLPDPRIRTVPYSVNEIYRLRGYVGYQIDVQFARGERFIGLGVGDAKGIAFAAEANHLFLKPRAAHVATDLTVLTNRRTYLFDYSAGPERPDPDGADVIFALRFEYPHSGPRARPGTARAARVAAALAAARRLRPRNLDYWYCGAPSLRPLRAWDDGVETTLVFGARTELPAVFVRNADGSDSLVNFEVQSGKIIVERVARRLILRLGKLSGCIVNRAFTGGGERLSSGTIAPDVERVTRRPRT